MRRATILVITALALIVATSQGLLAQERTPPGSFLDYRAVNVTALTRQVATNPTVRARYAQHFKMSPSTLNEYLAQNVKLVTLKSPLRAHVWYVTRTGKILSRTKVFPKGTTVFANAEGTPLLVWKCGNPLRASLPAKQVVKRPASFHKVAAAGTTGAKPVEVKVSPSPIETIAAAAVAAPPETEVVAALPEETLATAEVTAPLVPVPPAMGNSFALGWLGGLGGLLAVIPHHSPTPTPEPPRTVTPEPAGLLTLATGLAMGPLGMVRLKRSRARR